MIGLRNHGITATGDSLTEILDRQGKPAAWKLFSRVVNLAFLVTGGIAAVIILLAEPLVRYVIAPGFNDPVKWGLTASLMPMPRATT